MRWLVHGNVTRAAIEALVRHGHQVKTLTEAAIAATPPLEIAREAHRQQLDLITTDADLVNTPFDANFAFGRSIVFLQLTGGDVEQDDAIDRLFERYKRLSPGRLYTVTESRVKIRQLPTGTQE